MRNNLNQANTHKELFSPQEKDFFLTKIFEYNTPDSSFLYRGEGANRYEKVSKTKEYTAYNDELDLLRDNSQEIASYIGENIIDI